MLEPIVLESIQPEKVHIAIPIKSKHMKNVEHQYVKKIISQEDKEKVIHEFVKLCADKPLDNLQDVKYLNERIRELNFSDLECKLFYHNMFPNLVQEKHKKNFTLSFQYIDHIHCSSIHFRYLYFQLAFYMPC